MYLSANSLIYLIMAAGLVSQFCVKVLRDAEHMNFPTGFCMLKVKEPALN